MSLLGIGFDAGTVTPWVVAGVLWVVGLLAWRAAGARVRAAWDKLHGEGKA